MRCSPKPSALAARSPSPQRAQWGGYFGYFADPDGYLWKVAVGAGFAAE